MNDRLQNGALAGLLVLTLVLVGFSLRSRGTVPAPSDVAATPTSSSTASPSPTRTPAPAGPVVFLGDSVAEGRSATTPGKRWTAIVAGGLGLKEVNLGHARTGYLRIGPEGSCGDAACPNFKDSVRAAVAAAPSTVIVTGGGNDTGLDAEPVATAVSATLAGLRKALPEAKIYVVNPWWDLREQPDSLDDLTRTIADAAKTAGVTYLDTGQPLVGKPELMVASGTNPNDAGHAALAKAVTKALSSTPNA